MLETSDRRRCRKFKLRNMLRTLLAHGSETNGHQPRLVYDPGTVKRSRLKRAIYVLTTVTAFTLGLSVGVLVRFLMLPKINIAIDDKALTNGILVFNYTFEADTDNRGQPNMVIQFGEQVESRKNRSMPFSRVSFVSDVAAIVRTSVYRRILSPPPTTKSSTNIRLLNGIFWSDEIETRLPRGYDQTDADNWRTFLLTARVSKLDLGCGRMQNRLITFHDGSRACVRYRQNTDQIQGELFSFYLGRILNVKNLAPCSLSVVRTRSPQWRGVKPEVVLAGWLEERPIIVTKWVDRLRPAGIPRQFRSNARRFHPTDLNGRLDPIQLTELVQWSDLIIFDYLTANLDRIVNNLYNLQWNPGIMEAPAHNLAKTTDDNLLLFLDNESGLLHGYRLLDKYEAYHSVLLESLCVFRKPTIEILERLQIKGNVGKILNENLFAFHYREILPVLPERSIKILNDRINKVLDQVSWCRRQYMHRSNEVH